MSDRDISEQLVKYLTDVHSIEVQALAQMNAAPEMTDNEQLTTAFQLHQNETERQEQRVREALSARDASPSRLKDVAGVVTGKAFVLFARSQPDTPGKLVAHSYSYEHMEEAAYDLLGLAAARASDAEVAALAREIGDEERAMASRLEGLFDVAVDESLSEKGSSGDEDLRADVAKYLADAHALENQSIELLRRGSSLTGPPQLAQALDEHLAETRQHERLVSERLEALGEGPSRLKDAALRLGALNWGGFFGAQPDTPAKLAGFAYAVEHLEAGAYELLKRTAVRAGDQETAALAERILAEERVAGERLHSLFEPAVDEALRELGVRE